MTLVALFKRAFAAALFAGAFNLVIFLIAIHIMNVSFVNNLAPITEIQVVVASIVPAFGAMILILILQRLTAKPVLFFKIIATVLFLASLALPYTQVEDQKAMLILSGKLD